MCELPQFFNETRISSARKEYKCCECGSKISKKEPYIRSTGRCSSTFSTYKTCILCNDLKETIFEKSKESRTDGIPFTGLLYHAREYDDPEIIGKLNEIEILKVT